MFGSCSTQNPNFHQHPSLSKFQTSHAVQVRSHVDTSSTRFRGSGSGVAPVFVDQDQVRVRHNAFHKNLDFLAVLRVLREIVLF